jgi:hypothetical protein
VDDSIATFYSKSGNTFEESVRNVMDAKKKVPIHSHVKINEEIFEMTSKNKTFLLITINLFLIISSINSVAENRTYTYLSSQAKILGEGLTVCCIFSGNTSPLGSEIKVPTTSYNKIPCNYQLITHISILTYILLSFNTDV